MNERKKLKYNEFDNKICSRFPYPLHIPFVFSTIKTYCNWNKLYNVDDEIPIELAEYCFVNEERNMEIRLHIRNYVEKIPKNEKTLDLDGITIYYKKFKESIRFTWFSEIDSHYLIYTFNDLKKKNEAFDELIEVYKSIKK